jgi:hypothetical protein
VRARLRKRGESILEGELVYFSKSHISSKTIGISIKEAIHHQQIDINNMQYIRDWIKGTFSSDVSKFVLTDSNPLSIASTCGLIQ